MFRHLVNVWSFTPLSSSSSQPQTQVDLSLEYAFTSPLHAAAISSVWDKVSALMVQKFEDRVANIHGKR
jgi:coenzyme Q-binding protein COQ10